MSNKSRYSYPQSYCKYICTEGTTYLFIFPVEGETKIESAQESSSNIVGFYIPDNRYTTCMTFLARMTNLFIYAFYKRQ